MPRVWEVRRQPLRSDSFLLVLSRVCAQGVRLGDKPLYLLNHITGTSNISWNNPLFCLKGFVGLFMYVITLFVNYFIIC